MMVAAVVLWAEKLVGKVCWAAPERESPARDATVQFGPDQKPVVAVVLGVLEQSGDFIPNSPPRRPVEPEPSGKTSGIAERKIEADQHPFAACYRLGQPVGEQRLRLVSGGRIGEPLARSIMPADPDAVPTGPRHICRTPIDYYMRIEHQR